MAEKTTTDWTADKQGRSNSSVDFENATATVAQLLRNHRLGSPVEDTARLIMAQLAHVWNIGPRTEKKTDGK